MRPFNLNPLKTLLVLVVWFLLTFAIAWTILTGMAGAYCTPPLSNDTVSQSVYESCLERERTEMQIQQEQMQWKQQEIERRLQEMEDRAKIRGW